MNAINATLSRQASLAPIILRVILGVLLLLHGIDKFDTGISNVEGFFDSNGVPLAGLAAPFVAVAEIVIGIALIVGIGTRIAALVQLLILVGALAFVKLPTILGGGELDLAYIAGLAALVLLGPGRFSVDEVMDTDTTVIDLRSRTTVRETVNA